MLKEFGGYNFFSFKEGFIVSFKHKKEILDLLCIKGANASGKTNIIKFLSFIKFITIDSFTSLTPEKEMMIYSFFHNPNPISLYIVFEYNGNEYKYEIELTNKEILKEKIYKKNKRWSLKLERKKNKITKLSEEFKNFKNVSITRSNASVISIFHQYNVKNKDLDNIRNFFTNIKTNVGVYGRRSNEKTFPNYKEISQIYYKDPEMMQFVIEFMKKADTGIEDIKIIPIDNPETGKKEYIPIFEFIINGKRHKLQYNEQSNGVKSLYLQLGLYFLALQNQMVLALDEFDTELHPDLLPLLTELFENKKINIHNSQFIFTTHHTSIMDKLGKYRVILVNKEENESFLYRLDEIPGDILRPDRKVTTAYKAFKIGGRPRIKNG